MSSQAHAVATAGEDDRLEAQRQAFSRLMARFTADRDAMIAAVQQCKERIDTLTAQIAVGGGSAAVFGEASPGAGGADIHALMERTMSQQQSALAEARAAGERAQRRAEECSSRVRELAEQVAEREAGVDGLRQALEAGSERIARLEEAVLSQTPDEPQGFDDDVTREIAARLGGVEEHLRGLEDSIEALRSRSDRAAPDDPGGNQILNLGLRDLREQVSRLESLAAWTPKLQRLWVSLVASAVVAAAAVVYVR